MQKHISYASTAELISFKNDAKLIMSSEARDEKLSPPNQKEGRTSGVLDLNEHN